MDIARIEKVLDQLTGRLPQNVTIQAVPAPSMFSFDTIKIGVHNNRETFTAEYKSEPRLMHLPYFNARNYDSGPIIVIANHISTPVKEEFRKAKINYIDAAGNIYIDNTPILIFVDGQKKTILKETTKNRAFTKTGLKIVFALIQNPELVNLPYRTVADQLNVALDTVHNVINGLKDMGFIINVNEKKMRLINLKQLLDRWIQEYDIKLKPSLFIGNFRFTSNVLIDEWEQIKLDAPHVQWGGEPAGAIITKHLRPGELTLYTGKKKLDVMKELKLLPDPKGYIKLYQKFWQDQQPVNQYVPEVLVYADLLNHGDSRNAEIAQRIYEQHLQDRFI